MPDGVEQTDVSDGVAFNFTTTHFADVVISPKGELLQISYLPKYKLEEREPTELEENVELTLVDYDLALERAGNLRPLGELIKDEHACLVL